MAQPLTKQSVTESTSPNLGLVPEVPTAEALHLQPATLTNWRCQGVGPRYVKIGRRVFYPIDALHEYIAANTVNPEQHRAAPTLADGRSRRGRPS